MMKKKRAFSSVSGDRAAIEAALKCVSQNHLRSSSQGNSPVVQNEPQQTQTDNTSLDARSCNSPDTEEEWAHIVKTLERAGIPVDSISKRGSQASTSTTSSKNIPNLSRSSSSLSSLGSRMRLGTSASSRIQHPGQGAGDIKDLLKEPITMDQLQSWLKQHSSTLS